MNTQSDLTADDAAIADVIFRETDAFLRRDIADWKACWVDSPRTRDVYCSSQFGLTVIEGFDQILGHMKETMESGAGCAMERFGQENLQITRSDDMAWVVFDAWKESEGGQRSETFETRVVERKADGWKIGYSSFVNYRNGHLDRSRIIVDGTGQIVWMPDGVRGTISSHPGLCVSNGRLRARRQHWDKALQDAILRAGELHGFFQQYTFIADTGAAYRCPIILGEDEEGGIVVCTLFVQNGETHVELEPSGDLTARLAAAKVIFGLSDGQLGLAERITGGETLTHAAESLGISINTARTHLSRIYEKTGVNSQTALVRILLSVG